MKAATSARAPVKAEPSQPALPIAPLLLVLLFILLLAGFCLLPRINTVPRLEWSFLGAAAALLIFLLALWRAVKVSGRVLTYQFLPVKAHYVQVAMHGCLYAYWGWYWREVYSHIPLILGQVAFLYAFDMLVCWSRRDKWMLGFGPIPIIFSANLFLWFRDDWYWLQFLMIAVGVLCKEFIRWERDGRRTHIFNPSGIALFVFSVGLLAANATGITWGPEIAKSLHLPPYIYPEIFVLGLVVQGFFAVTLMTLSAAAVLYVLNLAYTHFTGVYYFVDSNIPVSVFIGLHLLVTDPATSPRRMTGKILFGGLYGAAVFALDGILGAYSQPQFYDKLLCVPFLNLSVRALDHFSERFAARFHPLNLMSRWGDRNLNYLHMGIWSALFAVMFSTGFVGYTHPGQSIAFWEKACAQNRFNACRTWAHALQTECRNNVAASCLTYAQMVNMGRVVPADPLQAGEYFGRACDLGLPAACNQLAAYARAGSNKALDQACDAGRDPAACYVAGAIYFNGQGVVRDDGRATGLFEKSCDSGFARGCGRLAQSYLMGRGREKNPALAARLFDKACTIGDAPSCYAISFLYLKGNGVQASELIAEKRMQRACDLGMKTACILADPNFGQNPNVPVPMLPAVQ